ncbi:MAG: 2-oxoglutarate and iron-dependent oxygenase domain-containing protein [Rhodocyclaceae bacterium]
MHKESTATRPAPTLPLIDVAALRGADEAARRAVGHQLRDACETRGFFYIKNHGIAPELIARAFEEAERFFDQPMDDKLAVEQGAVALQSWL